MMSIEVALKMASAIAVKYAERVQAKSDEERAKKIIASVVSAIKSSQKEIIDSMEQVRHRELAGRVFSLGLSLDDYLQVSNNANFLDEVLSRSGEYEGELKKEFDFDKSNDHPQLSLEEYSIYATLYCTRNLILAEYKHKWKGDAQKIDCKILSEIDDVLTVGEKVEGALRKDIEKRFGKLEIRLMLQVADEHEFALGYTLDGNSDRNFKRCSSKTVIHPPGPRPVPRPAFSNSEWDFCLARKEKDIDKIFQDFAAEFIKLRNTLQANKLLVSCNK